MCAILAVRGGHTVVGLQLVRVRWYLRRRHAQVDADEENLRSGHSEEEQAQVESPVDSADSNELIARVLENY